MAAKSKSAAPSELDTYLAMIRRFPLKPIKSDSQHDEAVEVIADLMGRKLDQGASDYLDTLIVLVNKYEDENHTPMSTQMSPQEALKAIMNVNGLSQAEVGRIIGSESAVSMFLKGVRGLSKAHIKALADKFRVDAGLFL